MAAEDEINDVALGGVRTLSGHHWQTNISCKAQITLIPIKT
jgi:hypothetical protein